MNAKYAIGTKYKAHGKRKDICTIIDIYKTYNSNGELVKIAYVSERDFIGQKLICYDVSESTIARGLVE